MTLIMLISLQVENLDKVRLLITKHNLQARVGDNTDYTSNRQQDSGQFLGKN